MAKSKFTNKGRNMAAVHFVDGSAVYIKSGHSIESEKEVKSLDKGVVEKPIKTTKILGSGQKKETPKEDGENTGVQV